MRHHAAAVNALAYFAKPAQIDEAIDALDRHQFGAWTNQDQEKAADELRALKGDYHEALYHEDLRGG